MTKMWFLVCLKLVLMKWSMRIGVNARVARPCISDCNLELGLDAFASAASAAIICRIPFLYLWLSVFLLIFGE